MSYQGYEEKDVKNMTVDECFNEYQEMLQNMLRDPELFLEWQDIYSDVAKYMNSLFYRIQNLNKSEIRKHWKAKRAKARRSKASQEHPQEHPQEQ
jgi:hypothetical protein